MPHKAEPAIRIPADLVGPVAVALARTIDAIPSPTALPGGSRYEPKWDGGRDDGSGPDIEFANWRRVDAEVVSGLGAGNRTFVRSASQWGPRSFTTTWATRLRAQRPTSDSESLSSTT